MPRRALLVLTVAIATVGVAVASGYAPPDLAVRPAPSTDTSQPATVASTNDLREGATTESTSTVVEVEAHRAMSAPSSRTSVAERRVASSGNVADDAGGASSGADPADRLASADQSSRVSSTTEGQQTTSDSPTQTTIDAAVETTGSPSNDVSAPAAESTSEPSPEQESTRDPSPAAEHTTETSAESTPGPETVSEPTTPVEPNDAASASSDGPTPVDSCTTIDEPGAYELTADVVDASTPVCIEINASDVVFDGGGYIVDGTDANETVGLLVRTDAPVTNVTVRNLVIRDWDDGIRASALEPGRFATVYGEDLREARFERVTSVSNLGTGIHLFEAGHVVVTDSTVEDNGLAGITFRFFDENNSITDSTIADNGGAGIRAYEGGRFLSIRNNAITGNAADGVRVQNDADRTGIVDNFVAGNGRAGITLSTSWSATIAGNRVESNGGPGILADDTGNDRIVENDVTENAADGILLDWADDNLVEGNEVRRNADAGISLRDSDDNTIRENLACDNGAETQILLDEESTGNAVANNTLVCP